MSTSGSLSSTYFFRAFVVGMRRHRDLRRQLLWYTFIGLVQLLVEWLGFVAFTAWGMPLVPANVVGRTLAALLGFSMNGTVTFQSELKIVSLVRFMTAWVPITLVDTLAISVLGTIGGLGVAWLVKPAVDSLIAVVSFLVARHWVFRAPHQSSRGPNDETSSPTRDS
jgi:putative flippase GtrA